MPKLSKKHWTGKSRSNDKSRGRDGARLKLGALMRRDGAKCRMCGATNDLTVDHILRVRHGGTNDINNLQILCRKCNEEKS